MTMARAVADLVPVIGDQPGATGLVPGTVVVIGHADASPAGTHYATNGDLSAARACIADFEREQARLAAYLQSETGET